jgi:hypothetical protein
MMKATRVKFKSSLLPLFQRGIFVLKTSTPLWKRREGEIFAPKGGAVGAAD